MATKIINDLAEMAAPAAGNWLLVETPSAAEKLNVAWLTSPTGGGAALAAHLADAVAAHAASAISFAPTGTVAAITVQLAIEEAVTEQAAVSATKVDLVGADDIEITDTTKGVILVSPDATRWRVTVDNAGALVVTAA